MNPHDMILALLWDLVAVVPALPLLGAAGVGAHMLSGRARGDEGERPTLRLATGTVAASLLLLLVMDGIAVTVGSPGRIVSGSWLASGETVLWLSFAPDALGLSVATLFAFIAWITLRFSAAYLHREAGLHRFFLVMNLFVAGMLLIALAGNAWLAFIGWELAGVGSFLLIGFAYDRPTATGNAIWAFVTNRIGDAGFILGIVLSLWWLGTAEWSELASAGKLEGLSARMLALGFLVAAAAKSAQLPFSPWIARALEGPTPSSAIFYGAVMVHAGVFLLLRLEPLLVQTPELMALLAVVGVATAIYGWLSGLTQSDVKSALIQGTTAQVGLMFLACGLGWFDVAAWHLALHASWRAYQFLMAPSYMHLVHEAAAPAPAWLSGRTWLYTAVLQRLWIEHLVQGLLVRPTQALGRDMRTLDDQVLGPLMGMSDEPALKGEATPARGFAGHVLVWIAGHLHGFESRLVLRPGGGATGRVLRRAGEYFLVMEAMLERPRYLMLLVMATFVVIL